MITFGSETTQHEIFIFGTLKAPIYPVRLSHPEWTIHIFITYEQRRSDCPVGPALDTGDGVADEEDGGGEGGPGVDQLEQIVTKTQLLRISTTIE